MVSWGTIDKADISYRWSTVTLQLANVGPTIVCYMGNSCFTISYQPESYLTDHYSETQKHIFQTGKKNQEAYLFIYFFIGK